MPSLMGTTNSLSAWHRNYRLHRGLSAFLIRKVFALQGSGPRNNAFKLPCRTAPMAEWPQHELCLFSRSQDLTEISSPDCGRAPHTILLSLPSLTGQTDALRNIASCPSLTATSWQSIGCLIGADLASLDAWRWMLVMMFGHIGGWC